MKILTPLVLSIVCFFLSTAPIFSFPQLNSNDLLQENSNKAFGDTIAFDDFSSGGPATGDLPSGWSSVDVDAAGNNFTWHWTNTGPTGSYGSDPFQSASSNNGWIMIDSDGYGQGSYNSYIYSPIYDCSAYLTIGVSFQEYYRKWGNEASNPYGNNNTYLGVSIDSGLTWTEIELHEFFQMGSFSLNPEECKINISHLAASAPAVQFYFRMQGYWDYWWQIDNFLLYEYQSSDLAHQHNYVSSVVYDSTNAYTSYGYYSQLPVNQLTPMRFHSQVENIGINPFTNLMVQYEVSKNGTNIFMDYSDSINSNPGDTSLLFSGIFNDTTAGKFQLTSVMSHTEIDHIPQNNVMPPISWQVNNNHVMARDKEYSSFNNYTVYMDPDIVNGVKYHITTFDKMQSVSVFIDARTYPSLKIKAQVFSEEQDSLSLLIESAEHEIAVEDLGTWITLPLNAIDPSDKDLYAGTNYVVGVITPEASYGHVVIGYDYSYKQDVPVAGCYDSIWTDMDSIPMIRFNLDGAIEPPIFEEGPLELEWGGFFIVCGSVNETVIYSLDFQVTDPNGLPVTIEPLTLPYFVSSFWDQGNGTYTLTFHITPDDISEFRIYHCEIKASNGISENIRCYNMMVLQEYGCTPWTDLSVETVTEMINIFPNPSVGLLHIENASGAAISIYNTEGKAIKQLLIESEHEAIDLSAYENGIYFINVIMHETAITRKISLIK